LGYSLGVVPSNEIKGTLYLADARSLSIRLGSFVMSEMVRLTSKIFSFFLRN